MNERLKELYQQSWRSQFVSGVRTGEDITLTEFDYEKFAELIVQECKQAVAAGLKSMKYTSFDVSYISRLVDPINTELDRILK